MPFVSNILDQTSLSQQDIVHLLGLDTAESRLLFEKSREVADKSIGRKVYFRGLIEYSNICAKNCYYCGIRKSNREQTRYTMEDEEVLDCAGFAFKENYGSIVIQAGERSDRQFVEKIEHLLKVIKNLSNGKLGITLSLGEQSIETYKRWFDAGAHRYLLRIETSGKSLYKRYHPADHSFDKRLEAIESIREAGFQLGTGVMIGLPGQTLEDLADDLIFIRQLDVDMVGMGPYIEHDQTPMYCDSTNLSKTERYELSLKMLAVLRLMMPYINMAATTAMQSLHTQGREQAILAGANVVMPNLTPLKYRECYMLYDGKPCIDEDPYKYNDRLITSINQAGFAIGLGEWGDSMHFFNKQKSGANEI